MISQDQASSQLLQLYLSPGTEQIPLEAVLQHFGSLGGIRAASDAQWRELGASARQRAALEAATGPEASRRLHRVLRWAESPGRAIVPHDASNYPGLLREIPDAPLFIFLEGRDPALLNRAQVAVVGARKASPAAQHFTEQLCARIVGCGLVLTSGMAYGIDACAHRAALAGHGPTIAVHGCGLGHCYPAAHAGLRAAIAAEGLHVSEFGPEAPPRKSHFPRRNRLISGLARVVLIMEAGERSGSLGTARHALAQGREVLVAPGPAGSSLCRGSNLLLRDGAQVLLELADVLAALPPDTFYESPDASAADPKPGLSNAARHLHSLMTASPEPLDAVLARSSLPAASAIAAVTELELAGAVLRHGGLVCRSG